MNRSTTTPFKKLLSSAVLIAAATLVGVSTPATVIASRYQDQINAIQSDIDRYQGEASQLRQQADTLANRIAALNAEKASVQSQIDLSQAKYDQLVVDISNNEIRLQKQQAFLGKTLASLYVESDVSDLELLASSESVGDFITKQEYRTAVRNQIQTSMRQVKVIRTQLVDQRKSVEGILAEQKSQREQLAEQEAEQQRLLTETRGQEAAYQSLIGDLQQQRSAAEAALAATLSSGKFSVAPEGYVQAGSIVGAVGNTGFSTGPHLHLETRSGSQPIDSSSYMEQQPTRPAYVTQGFNEPNSWYYSGYHSGIDYAPGDGQPIYAIKGGTLYRGCSDAVLNTSGNPFGYVAVVDYGNGVRTIYAHMQPGPDGGSCNYNTFNY